MIKVNKKECGYHPIFTSTNFSIISLSKDTIRKIGLKNILTQGAGNYIQLNKISNILEFDFDLARAQLNLLVNPEYLGRQLIDYDNEKVLKVSKSLQQDSAFLNYNFSYQRDLDSKNSDSGSLGFDTGVNVKDYLINFSLYFNYSGNYLNYGRSWLSMRHDLTERMLTLNAGEIPVMSTSLAGYANILGVNLSKNYSLNPFFETTAPVNSSGVATTPSILEIFINDQLIDKRKIEPGIFNISNLPVQYGKGDIKLVLTDIYGKKNIVESSFLRPSTILKKGLHEYSYNLGLLDETGDFDYKDIVFSGYHRYGFNSSLTAGLWSNISRKGHFNAGFVSSFKLGTFSEITIDGGYSSIEDLHGFAFNPSAYFFLNKRIYIFGSSNIYLDDYGSVFTPDNLENQSISNDIGINLNITSKDSIYFNIGNTHYMNEKNNDSIRANLTYSRGLTNKLNSYIDCRYEKTETDDSFSIIFVLSYRLRKNKNLYLENSITKDSNGSTLSFSSSKEKRNGFDYDVSLSRNSDSLKKIGLSGDYAGTYGEYSFGFSADNQNTQDFDFNATGSLALIDGRLVPSRIVTGSYALVKVGELKNVQLLLDESEIGRTDKNGYCLVSDLMPYMENHLSIGTENVSINYIFPDISKTLIPSSQSGSLIEFPVKKLKIAEGYIYIKDRKGNKKPAELASLIIFLKDKKFKTFVGEKGIFSMHNIPSGTYKANLFLEGLKYEFEITIPDSENIEIKLDDIILKS